jgi:hypothetical protein
MIALVALSLVVGLASTSTAGAESHGVVQGIVTNGTTGEPVPNTIVTLSSFNADGLIGDVETTTDDDGGYRFEGLDTADGIVHAVSTNYLGVLYSSGMLLLNETASLTSDLSVYETTTDAGVVTIESRGIILTTLFPEDGQANIIDVFVLRNDSRLTLVVNDQARTNAFPVPTNAIEVSPLPGYDFGQPSIEGATVYATTPLRPGTSTASLGYSMPYLGTRLPLEVGNVYRTEVFRVLVPISLAGQGDQVRVTGNGVTDQGLVEIGSETYHLWEVPGVDAGGRLRLAFEGLPVSAVEANTLSKLQPVIVATAAVVVTIVAAAVIVRRRELWRPRPVVLAPVLVTSLEERREVLVSDLRSLETAREEAVIEPAVYERERRLILEELRVISRRSRGLGDDEV